MNANEIDFDTVLRDEHYSDIITIGHGNLSTIIIGDDYGADIALDWYDLSIFTDHLRRVILFSDNVALLVETYLFHLECSVLADIVM